MHNNELIFCKRFAYCAIFLSICLFPLANIFSQTYQWAAGAGGLSWNKGNAVETDHLGNVYMTGWFSGSADFDPGPGVHTLTAYQSDGDIFVAKYSPAGTYLWAFSIRSNNVGQIVMNATNEYDLDVDPSGNVLITGAFKDTSDFDPGPGTVNLISQGQGDIFVAKYSTTGAYLWAFSMGNTRSEAGRAIVTDASGNVFVTGSFTDAVDFNPGAGTAILTTAFPIFNSDLFVAKYDPSGVYLWAFNVGGSANFSSVIGQGIDVNSLGGVAITGYFTATADFDPAIATTVNLTSANPPGSGFQDMFVAQYSSAGIYQWAFNVGKLTRVTAGYDIAIDELDNILVTGIFADTMDFDPSSGIANIITPWPGHDMYVAKYSSSGAYNWAFTIQSQSSWGFGIAADANNNVLITGSFDNPADFDPGPGTVILNPLQVDLYAAKYSPAGAYLWAFKIGGGGGCQAQAITSDDSCNIYITGNYSLSPDFDPQSTTATMTALWQDIYIAKYSDNLVCSCLPNANASPDTSICNGSSITLTATGGGSYLWNTGDTSNAIIVNPTTDTTYYVTVTDICGIATDSVIVSVNPVPSANAGSDTAMCTGTSITLTASGGGNYSWSTGETTAVVAVAAAGTYSVIVSIGSCSDTASVTLTVNPNPTAGAASDTTITQGQSAILTASGGGNYSWTTGATTATINISPSSTTAYCVTVTDTNSCTNTACVTVTVDLLDCGEIFVPTAFSPNSDGKNELECVLGDCIETFSFAIYDRWGEKVFITDNPKICWDGNYKGKPMNTATFVYYLEATLTNGIQKNQKGNISLIR